MFGTLYGSLGTRFLLFEKTFGGTELEDGVK